MTIEKLITILNNVSVDVWTYTLSSGLYWLEVNGYMITFLWEDEFVKVDPNSFEAGELIKKILKAEFKYKEKYKKK